MKPTILLTHEARLRDWQLQPPLHGTAALLGWRTSAELEIDAAVPENVAFIFARALTRIGRVSFPSSERPPFDPADSVQVFEAKNLVQWVRDRISRTPAKTYFISTGHPETARLLFEDGMFPWSMQATLALMTAPDSGPLRIDRHRLFELMELRPFDFHTVAETGMFGAFVPGVDGAVGAVIARDPAEQARILAAIEQEARSAGFCWRVCSGQEFGEDLARGRLSDSPPGNAAVET